MQGLELPSVHIYFFGNFGFKSQYVVVSNGILYAGSWRLLYPEKSNSSSPMIRKSNGDAVLELITTPTKSRGVYHVKVICLTRVNLYDS